MRISLHALMPARLLNECESGRIPHALRIRKPLAGRARAPGGNRPVGVFGHAAAPSVVNEWRITSSMRAPGPSHRSPRMQGDCGTEHGLKCELAATKGTCPRWRLASMRNGAFPKPVAVLVAPTRSTCPHSPTPLCHSAAHQERPVCARMHDAPAPARSVASWCSTLCQPTIAAPRAQRPICSFWHSGARTSRCNAP